MICIINFIRHPFWQVLLKLKVKKVSNKPDMDTTTQIIEFLQTEEYIAGKKDTGLQILPTPVLTLQSQTKTGIVSLINKLFVKTKVTRC